jgi:heliorhodopsin
MQDILRLIFGSKPNLSDRLLNKWNVILVALYAIEGGAILLLSSAHFVALNSLFATNDSLQTKLTGETVTAPAIHQLFTINLVGPVAAFIFISAITYLLSATIYRQKYDAWLKRGINPFRWIQYGLSGGIMLCVIGILSGVYDIASLLMIFVMTIIVAIFGYMLEARSQTRKQKTPILSRLESSILVLVGIMPWVVIGFYIVAANIFGSGVAGYVYLIYLSTLVLFAAIAYNTCLTLIKKNNWSNYLYGERLHMMVSFVVQSLLALLIFIDVLHP